MNKSKTRITKATIVTVAVMVIWLMVARVFAAESVERDRYLLLDSRRIEDWIDESSEHAARISTVRRRRA